MGPQSGLISECPLHPPPSLIQLGCGSECGSVCMCAAVCVAGLAIAAVLASYAPVSLQDGEVATHGLWGLSV